MPLLQQAERVRAGPLDPANAMAKVAAGQLIPLYRSLLYPEDDDG